ncbi:hypothetical protein IFM89_021071 [Coptis chinensis]|uniref:DNA topoisomerase 2 n=1 Tax=Coptis chinensis TaxID=261450 RepID=A0A835H4H5_9MAGN|nr:hypothetical protein IFM89_021071 [Coptis chinensis]
MLYLTKASPLSMEWCSDAYSDTVLGYANSIRTVDGGTHIDGVKASLTRTLNNLGKKSKLIKEKDISLSGEHVREGLTCVISVKVPNSEFEGQTKTRLGNQVRRVVDQSVQEYLTECLELHPDVLDLILSKSLNALKAALKGIDPAESGCSASSTHSWLLFYDEDDECVINVKDDLNSSFDEAKPIFVKRVVFERTDILPLRGKILNIERKDQGSHVQKSRNSKSCSFQGEDFKKETLRYHKIIIMTDANVDGAHKVRVAEFGRRREGGQPLWTQ